MALFVVEATPISELTSAGLLRRLINQKKKEFKHAKEHRIDSFYY